MMGVTCDHQFNIMWFFYPSKTRLADVTNRHGSDGKQNARWRFKSPASRVFTQPFIQGADQRKTPKVHVTGDRLIPRTKGQ